MLARLAGLRAGTPGEGGDPRAGLRDFAGAGGGSLAGLRTRKQKVGTRRGVGRRKSGLGTRSARGAKESGAFGRMEGGGAGSSRGCPLGRGPAAAGLELCAQSIRHSANVRRAHPVCGTPSWALRTDGAHPTRTQTPGHLANIHQTPAMHSQQSRPCSWEMGTPGGGGRTVSRLAVGAWEAAGRAPNRPHEEHLGHKGQRAPRKEADGDEVCVGRSRAGSRGRGRTGALPAWGALEGCGPTVCSPAPPGGSGENRAKGTVRSSEVGGRGESGRGCL